ncbi:MAG TPA: arsenite methyltransferase [Gemmatimonadaceae bacterium]|jgi:SAM-dependent methyltransferase|nr:arsenite methyltransferase [Gemmatimonadaceae bacterium]
MSTVKETQERVRARYGAIASEVSARTEDTVCCGKVNCCSDDGAAAATKPAKASCCGTGEPLEWDPITSDLYDEAQTEGLPMDAVLASLGCGNPTALAELHAGETVLDLGSGGGIDVLLSARRVGPTGRAIGLDMTDEMLALARKNQQTAGATNVEFVKGTMESMPLPDGSVDVIISNCVINLSADKRLVMQEAFRVLKPGGRLAISDIVHRGEMPATARANADLWCGCVSGALSDSEYGSLLGEAGFTEIEIEPTRVYGEAEIRALAGAVGAGEDSQIATLADSLMSAFIRARKPK